MSYLSPTLCTEPKNRDSVQTHTQRWKQPESLLVPLSRNKEKLNFAHNSMSAHGPKSRNTTDDIGLPSECTPAGELCARSAAVSGFPFQLSPITKAGKRMFGPPKRTLETLHGQVHSVLAEVSFLFIMGGIRRGHLDTS